MTTIIELKGNWNEQKGKLKQKFATLTDNDLLFLDGKKDEMLGKLQAKLGKTKEELHKIIGAL
ncbi:MAG TPA: CsbD family protein [Chitinophagaceae bacterium]|nr:CsbD family protein [Chitinophagaceae bacterium]